MRVGAFQTARACPGRFWIAALLLPAILSRALIPAGFMPVVGAEGQSRMQFCPGMGLAATAGSLPGQHRAGKEGDPAKTGHERQTCQFASSAGPAALGFPGAAAAAGQAGVPPAGTDDTLLLAIPTVIRTQSARAPPFQA